MARRFVDQLTDGDNLEDVFLVLDKQLRTNRKGENFILIDLADRTGSISARLFNAGEPVFRTFEIGDYIHARGKVQLFQGILQTVLTGIEKIDSNQVELTDFLPHTRQDVNKLFARLKEILRKVSDPFLKSLTECYLIDEAFVRDFCRAPAGIRVHHAYIGGLLEHTVTMLEIADRSLPFYPEVNKDVVLVGIFLHDSGKIHEMSYQRSFAYTDEGQMVGHLVMGIEMLAMKAKEAEKMYGEPVPPELLMHVKHLILSHHGEPQHGSPKLPMSPEAVLVRAIDMIDSQVHIALKEIADDKSDGNWTAFNHALQRKVYKGKRV